MSCELLIKSLKTRVEIQKYEFKSTSHEFKSTSYEFKFMSCEFKFMSFLVPLINTETKRWNFGLALRSPSLNKVKNTKDTILAVPKQDFLLRATTTHPTTIKEVQTIRITKLGLLSLPHWFLTEGLKNQNWKANTCSPPPGKDLGPFELDSILQTIMLLIYIRCCYPETIYI